jgi:hypothetical protein
MAANCLGSRDQAMKDDLQCLQENLSHLVSPLSRGIRGANEISPAAKPGDILGTGCGMGFTEESGNMAAVLKPDLADP